MEGERSTSLKSSEKRQLDVDLYDPDQPLPSDCEGHVRQARAKTIREDRALDKLLNGAFSIFRSTLDKTPARSDEEFKRLLGARIGALQPSEKSKVLPFRWRAAE